MNNQNNQYPLGGYNQNQYNQQGMPIGNQMYNMNQPQGHSGLAIASFVLALLGCTSLIGLILGIVDVVVNKQRKHGLSIAAIVISAVWLVLSLVIVVPDEKNVPDLLNYEPTEAVRELENMNNNYTISKQYEFSDTVDKGLVTRTNPAFGMKIDKDSKITVYISKGKAITIPDLVNHSVKDGKKKIDELGLEVEIQKQNSDVVENGNIIATEPTANSEVEEGSKVILTVSKGTKKQEMKRFKKKCETPSYDDLIRNPDKYSETPIKIKVKIDKIEAEKFLGIEYGKAYWATYNGETIIIRDDREVQEPALREGDKVTIYGYGDGTDTIKSKQREYQGSLVFGFSYDKTVDEYEVPSVKIQYIDF